MRDVNISRDFRISTKRQEKRRPSKNIKPPPLQRVFTAYVEKAWWECILYSMIAGMLYVCCKEAAEAMLKSQTTSVMKSATDSRMSVSYKTTTDHKTGQVEDFLQHCNYIIKNEASIVTGKKTTQLYVSNQTEVAVKLMKLKNEIKGIRKTISQQKLVFHKWKSDAENDVIGIYIGNQMMTWYQARDACVDNDAGLIQETLFDQNILQSLLDEISAGDQDKEYWIGMRYYEKKWRSLDGSVFACHKNWLLEQLLSSLEKKTLYSTGIMCAVLSPWSKKVLDARPCDERLYYPTCEKSHQTIKDEM